MKIQTISITHAKEAITRNQQIDTFCYHQMEHKGGHWLVHEECIVHTAVCQKATEATPNSEKIKVVALAFIELCSSERH